MKDLSIMRKQIKENIDKADEKTVAIIHKILEDDSEDLLENISAEQEASFNRGIKDSDEGRVTPHKEVMKRYKKWLTK